MDVVPAACADVLPLCRPLMRVGSARLVVFTAVLLVPDGKDILYSGLTAWSVESVISSRGMSL